MIHGVCKGGQCTNIGAFFVARELLPLPPTGSVNLGRSATIGEEAIVEGSYGYFAFPSEAVRAIVFEFGDHLSHIRASSPTKYVHHLATRESSLGDTQCLAVLAADEQITSVRASFHGNYVTSVQVVTTRQTTVWFGPAPDKSTSIITRNIDEKPSATHIGGFCGMRGDSRIKSLAVVYYKQTD